MVTNTEDFYESFKKQIRKFYREQTGEELNEPNIYQKKDLVGRWLFWLYFDPEFKQNGIYDRIDGIASGTACEIKTNTYGFNELSKIIIDKSKVDSMPADGRVVFLYIDFDEGQLSKRQFTVKDIKKYGELSHKGGKVDNVSLKDSDKPVYYVGHEHAEAEATWKKGGRKS